MRENSHSHEEMLRGGRWRWTSADTRCACGGQTSRFPPKEFELLEAFLRGKTACSRVYS